jgi:ATP-dependent DNA helicase RecG
LIEESEKVDLRAATAMADHLAQDVFQAYRVALLHGRMKQDAKDRVMRAFAAGRSTCWCRRPSSKSGSTCRTRR